VPVVSLKASPFSIAWAAPVYAKITAINIYGNSVESDGGNGAYLQAYPDAPSSIEEVFESRTPTDLGFTWTPGFDGGTPVIDYEVQYTPGADDNGFGVFVTVETNELSTSFLQGGLTIGVSYKFRVKSRNSFGQSLTWSEELLLYCASVPLAPSEPYTQAVDSDIKVTWVEPYD
jgi:hypothetical protein